MAKTPTLPSMARFTLSGRAGLVCQPLRSLWARLESFLFAPWDLSKQRYLMWANTQISLFSDSFLVGLDHHFLANQLLDFRFT